MPVLDLRLAERRLAVELLELLDMHPSVTGPDGPEQSNNLHFRENRRCITKHESASKMIDERHAPSARRKHHRPAISDHLQFERGWLGQQVESHRQFRWIQIRFDVHVESDQASAFRGHYVYARCGRRNLDLLIVARRADLGSLAEARDHCLGELRRGRWTLYAYHVTGANS